jgi:hypothetical protein
VTLKLAHHQFHVDLLARDVPQLQCLAYRYARVFLAVRDRERYRDLLSIVQRRDALEKRADFRVALVAILMSSLVTSPIRCIFEKRYKVGDSEIGKAACEFGRKVHEGCLVFICGHRESKACRESKRKTGSDINHVPAIYRAKIRQLEEDMRREIRTRSANDGNARSDKLALHILSNVVQEGSDIPNSQYQQKQEKQNECPHLTESSRLNTSSIARYRFPYPVLPRTLGYIMAQPSSFSK